MLYNENGIPVTTHSMIKTMRRCPRQALYKLHDRLKPRFLGRQLTLGKWMHYLLEVYYQGGDWKAVHTELCRQYGEFFDEEKEMLGDLPTICYNLMQSYLWHYKHDNWRVLAVELTIQTRWPDGSIYRGKVDLLIENDYGLWIVDHKNHKILPKHDYRMLDTQSPLYVWAIRRGDPENGFEPIPVMGFIWNYIRTAEPSKPVALKNGSRISKKLGDTTFPVFVKEMKRLGFDPFDDEYRPISTRLARDRFKPGQTQSSPFFQRHVLERDDDMLARLAAEAFRTHKRLHSYPFHQRDTVERSPDFRGCRYSCSYTDLCQTELMGGITGNLIRQNFKTGDPLSYHYDQKDLTD